MILVTGQLKRDEFQCCEGHGFHSSHYTSVQSRMLNCLRNVYPIISKRKGMHTPTVRYERTQRFQCTQHNYTCKMSTATTATTNIVRTKRLCFRYVKCERWADTCARYTDARTSNAQIHERSRWALVVATDTLSHISLAIFFVLSVAVFVSSRKCARACMCYYYFDIVSCVPPLRHFTPFAWMQAERAHIQTHPKYMHSDEISQLAHTHG